MTNINEQIQSELDEARSLDEQARVHRLKAGWLLSQARELHPVGSAWHKGLDKTTAELLIQMAAGRE